MSDIRPGDQSMVLSPEQTAKLQDAMQTADAKAKAAASSKNAPNLYDRRFSIQVYDASGKGLDLSALRCRFAVRQVVLATPNHIDLTITNLSAATASRMQKEFTRVQVSAGYEGQYGIIFDGTIIQARRGRSSPTDTFCHIVATDGDQPHNQAVLNTTLAAGSKPEDVHRVALTAMNQFGVEKGYTDPAMTGPGLPRGRTLFGMARDTLRDLGRTTNTQWSIQSGRLQVSSPAGYLPTQVVVITKETGMIGLPVIAPDGVQVRCLLNPLLRVDQRIRLNNSSIQTPRLGPSPQDKTSFALYPEVEGSIEGDGLYKVLAVDHFGDTRGNEWYSQIEAIGISQSGTLASANKGRGTYVDPSKAASAIAPLPPVAVDQRPLSVTQGAGI